MVTIEEVTKLASLARVSVSEEALPKFTKEFDAILAYVGQLEKLEVSKDLRDMKPLLRNVMRADGEPDAPGAWTEKIVKAFPKSEENALVVKQIITHE